MRGLLLGILLVTGCGEDVPESTRGSTSMLIEESSSPLVQSALSDSNTGVTVKYLAGETTAEADGVTEDHGPQSMSFLVAVRRHEEISDSPEATLPGVPVALFSDELKSSFWIETGEAVFAPDIVQLEHQGNGQRRYLVVFGIPPSAIFEDDDTMTFAFENPQGSSATQRFTFSSKAILGSSDLITQLRQ